MIYAHNDHGLRRAIGYDVHGEGPAVLLLHPFPFDRRFWQTLALPGYRVIAMDARGYGDSAVGEPGYSIDDLAEDAVALLDHLGVAMACAVGCSMGGYVALAIAALHPARLSAMVLLDSRAGADGEAARANRDAAITEIKARGPRSFLDGVAVRLCGRSASAEVRSSVQALSEGASPDFSRALPAALVALRDRPDRAALLPKLRIPVLVAVGEEDTVTPPDEARAMHGVIPGAELAVLEGCGHLPSWEGPARTSEVLATFLSHTIGDVAPER